MIKQQLIELSTQYPRYGFNMLFHLLREQGTPYNHKRVYRIYCELGLNLKVKPKKRLAPRTAVTLASPSKRNQCWSLDYMSDSLDSGRRFRTANVIDDCHRGGLGILISFSLPAKRVTCWLEQLIEKHGTPKMIRVDNGPENLASHFKAWANKHDILIQYIQPGKPAQNAYIERFNRSYREAVLDMYLFRNLAQVRKLTNEWLKHYNQERPHASLGYLTPHKYIKNCELNYSSL